MFDYRRNSDYYSYSVNKTPYNAVLDILFSDSQTVDTGSGQSSFTYSATGDEYSFQDDRLIDATIILLFRDGLNYYETENDFTFLDKEFQFDDTTGTIAFPGSPFPPLQPGEKVNVLYESGTGDVVITEPVLLNEAKNWLKVEVDDDDALIEALITAARQCCEGYTNLSFVEREVTAILKNDLGGIRFPYGPVGNIVSMHDSEGTEITDYDVQGVANKRLITPDYCYVKAVYTAGYLSLPRQLKTGLLMQLAWMYQRRGDVEATEVSPEARLILYPYRSVV